MTNTYILVIGISYASAYESNCFLHKEKNIIYIRNILGTML